MKRFKGGVIAGIVLLLTACSGISSGTVIEKHYEGPYTYSTQQCAGYNANGGCTVWIPIFHHVDEQWVVTLENKEGDKGTVEVEKKDYDSIEIGTIYTKPGEK